MITKFIKSMGYALKGICLGIKEERNMRIDTVAMLFVWSICISIILQKVKLRLSYLSLFLFLLLNL